MADRVKWRGTRNAVAKNGTWGNSLGIEDLQEAWSLNRETNVVSVVLCKDVNTGTIVVPSDAIGLWSDGQLLQEGLLWLFVAIAHEVDQVNTDGGENLNQFGDPNVKVPPGHIVVRLGCSDKGASLLQFLDYMVLVASGDEQAARLGGEDNVGATGILLPERRLGPK